MADTQARLALATLRDEVERELLRITEETDKRLTSLENK